MSYLRASSISKKYGSTQALADFSLTVDESQVFALVGPDGAGKTTFIRILCNLIQPDSGDIEINGIDARKSFEHIKAELGYMPQQFSLYPDLSVEENLMFYGGLFGITGKAFRQKRDYLYEFSNLAPFAKRRAQALSGGMKQKLALSCALIHDPRLLILDEPTTGVDPLSRRQFWEILLELKSEGVAILVSTPYMDEVARCDRACFIFGGKKLSEGAPDTLASQFRGKIYYISKEPTVELVKSINSIDGVSAARFGAGLHLSLPEDRDISDFLDRLRNAGIPESDITQIDPDLEDRFIQLMEESA